MNRVQDAINDLRDYLDNNNLHSGSVYIAAGTYVPTESTEAAGGSMLNTSFKIYGGIHVYGGFNPDAPESRPGDRVMVNGKKCSENWADQSGIGTVSGTEIASQWDLRYKTILTGNHSSSAPTFVYDSIRGKYTTAYAASSYHVVWFATNGIWPATDDLLKNHYKPLNYPASIDGCVISSGNASSRNINFREHTGYGGGVYMVGNTSIRNCIVERCSANMRGGGIYADGGGTIEFCLIQACQSAGVGVYQGYGGGVCIDHEGSIGHSQVTSCAARCGGGIFISHVPEDYPTTGVPAIDNISNYSPHATACVVNNNTTNAEGAGIYLAEGGTVNHCTVTANNCMGPDVTYYGRRHGRTGGIYVRNCGQIFNSVFWGNRCAVNNDIQFASVRQKTGVAGYETFVYHSAFMNHDITDWTGVSKEAVYSLDKHNMPVEDGSDNFPCFFSPTVVPLNWDSVNTSAGIYGAGVFRHLYPVQYPGPRIWHLTSHSYLDQKGVQWSSAMVDPPKWLIHAHTDYGVVSNPFEPASTLGALVRKPDKMRHSMRPQQGLEGRKDATTLIPTVFVDLSHEGDYDAEGRFLVPDHSGDSWDAPLHSIGDALMYYRTYLVETPGSAIGSRAHYHLPSAWDSEGNPTAYEDYDYVQMLVKEGEQSTAGPNNYLGKDMRTASIRTLSHMRLYGGYPKTLTGTSTEGRDPLNHSTVITANIANEKGETAYANNSAHVLTYVNTEYTIVDGFQLLNGNAHNLTGSAVMAGGGVLVSNDKNVITNPSKRIDMVGNELRNCRLANNSAPKGAAIYVTGDSKPNLFYTCYAELKVVNCIIRNNTADYSSGNNGVITANGRAFIDIDHCDIVNNVGYPLQSDNRWWKDGQTLNFKGNIRIDNSLIYCNGTEVLNDRSALAANTPLSVDASTQDYIFGTYNMFDADIQLYTADETQPHGFFKSDFTVDKTNVLPPGMPDAANHPLNLVMPAEKYNQCNLTRTDRNAATYPVFVNPSRNIGHSVEGDRPLYGGKVSFIPLNNNPCVNAASVSAYGANNVPRPDAEDFDLTDYTRRNYGGEPDIGALEDTDLPVSGAVIYVTPNGAGKRDGSSWANAIAGNTVYVLNDIAGPALATGDQIDPELTCDRVLDSEGNPRLTTDSLYSGGWGRVWITGKNRNETTTHTTKALVTATNTYTGGGPNDRVETTDPFWETTSDVTPGSSGAVSGFEPGYDYDPRYPYGEISGASRSFWRANPYHNGTDWNNAADYADRNAFINACNANGWIKNTRAERYVGGLQYAVEKASEANKTYHSDSVQVWVGAGKYTDYKGFIMRDSVTVLGGFPAGKYKSPGITERQALMSAVVSIPKSKPAEKLNAVDYETILQISDINPKRDNTHMKTDSVKYWDDDYSVDEIHDTETVDTATITRTATYTWTVDYRDTTTTYIRFPKMLNAKNQNVFHKDRRTRRDRDGNSIEGSGSTYFTTNAGEEIGGITWNGEKVVFATFGEDRNKYGDERGNKGWEIVYEDGLANYNINWNGFGYDSKKEVIDSLGNKIEDSPHGMALQGYMKRISVWQTMKGVPAGNYQLKIDLGASYDNDKKNTDTRITFYILASDGDTLVEKENVYCQDSKLRRYEFKFTQPTTTTGDLTIRVMSTSGTRHATATNGANNRTLYMSNVQLLREVGTDYVLTEQNDDKVITGTSGPIESTTGAYTVQNHRTTLRKRVLTMPDVCVPTYGAGTVGNPTVKDRGKFADDLSHTHRVFGPSKAKRSSWKNADFVREDRNYIEYNEANWDGFTIRHGFIADEAMGHGGGAGVNMYEGAHLRNCIVINNMSYCPRVKGGGIYCDGATSTIEGCFVLNNTSAQGTNNIPDDQKQVFAGGMFMYEGTCFNSLFANNYSYGSAGGVGFCVGKFYNNTIAYNTCKLEESGHLNGGAISVATESTPNLFVANTIVYGNNGMALRERTESTYQGKNLIHPFINCYIQTDVAFTQETYRDNIVNYTEGAKKYGKGNILLQETPSAATTPFAADFDESGNYVAGRAASLNDFRLRDGVGCVNKGTEDFAGDLLDVLERKHSKTEAQVKEMPIYKSVEAAELPDNDVAFAKRVQDCQIDMGAYEFNAAYNIKPDTTTHPGQAIYYVTFDAQGGDASANSPANAACKQKLQLVLDAAGRYKNNLMTLPMYNKGEAGTYTADQPNKHWSVEVWLEGDDKNSTVSGEYNDWYTATRSTKHNMENYVDNTLDYSFIIPHGVQVKGGYSVKFFHYEDAAGNEVEAGTPGATLKDERDPLTYRTVLSGKITSSTGAEGNTFHVVTFTNDLFTPDEEHYMDGDNPIRNQLAFMTDEKDRAVLDGLFIMDGHANSPDMADRIGAAAVVTHYAHIRNCVIQENTAEAYGGGLYLKPYALVSGTIIKNNTAETGGGVYIEAPSSLDSLARVFSSTICENTARSTAGGMYFNNTYARVNSTALWHNEANDYANISGVFSRSSEETDYPLNFCAVESRRLEGQGNVELSPKETEGVRWDRQDPFNAILYYPIEMSSTLSRAGMTYNEWRKTMGIFTTLDSVDIAGVSRTRWLSDGSKRNYAWGSDTLVTKNNDFIEIGARAINKNFAINIDSTYVMNRLYVMHTDLINSEAARALQDNTLNNDTANMYRQMGSCILNPFHRLGDAFDYVIAARKANPALYRNRVFSVFIEQGTYYPYHNAYGEQDEVRNNTFLVPEAIYVIGGVDSRPEDHHYGQEGYYDLFTGASYGDPSRDVDVRIKLPSGTTTSYTINASSLDSIRLRDERHRPMRDNNLNSVIEPWELERQTILSGNAVAGEDFTHVYHVITMHADSNYVGPQPLKFRQLNPARAAGDKSAPLLIDPIPMDKPEQFVDEIDLSILGRTTEFDGIQITGGYANHLNPEDTLRHPYVKKTYFRGGGIFVDGNWDEDFNKPSDKLPNVTEPAKYNIPIVVENSFFTNNMAGNGGAVYSNGGIYMYGCHFVQNYSQGPMTEIDQRFIPWTAGGCIATNAFCGISNTLFDNNEARRGLYPITVSGDEEIPYADARQGFGGVLSVASQARARIVNCHFMKNKAVAYPSIYNFYSNSQYNNPDSMQFAFNTIFWGNEVFEVDKLADIYSDDQPVPEASEEAFRTKYKNSRKGVFHYDPVEWDKYETLFSEYDALYKAHEASDSVFHPDVIAKLMELRAQGDKLEGLYFCSYRKTYGPTGMKPTAEGYLLTKDEQHNFVDPRQKPVQTKIDHGFPVEDLRNLYSYVHGNNNTLINPINTATDGPNFKQPSFIAGIDGYMQNADWLLARMNLTTDQGWGHLKQTVTRGVGYYITKYTGTKQFETLEDAWAYIKDTLGANVHDIYPVHGLPIATFNDVQDSPGPIYNWYSKRYGAYMSDVNAPLPIKDQYYMAYSRTTNDEKVSGNMDRISKHPKTGETDVYIDVGIYEYQYVQLDIKGQEIDTMWVATKAKDPIRHDGLTWETPTTDLQAAIDILMSSHNSHDKYVCFLGDDEGGTFSPSNVIDNRRAFIITSNTLEPLLPDSAEADHDYGVNSLTFLGGYSYDVKDAPRDPQAHPTIIEMPNIGTAAQRNQLFIVEDMTRQMVQANWQGEYTSRDSVVIPIVFDGMTFINPYSTKDPSSDVGGYNNQGGLMSKKGGAAIYYRWQRRYEGVDGVYSPDFTKALHPDSALIDGVKTVLPKLTLSNCIFMDNGARDGVARDERSAAVRIDHGGGSSLIVNSLFHSNAGAPVYAKTFDVIPGSDLASVPNDVVIINSTSALNDGHIRLEGEHSEVHNSLIWLDDLNNDTTIQLQMGASDQWDKTTNSERGGIDDRMTNNAVWGCFKGAGAGSNKNDNLVTENRNLANGPGFVLPFVSASTSEQRRERSFRLNPSVITHEKADTTLYRDRVFFRVYPDTCAATHNQYWRRSNGFKSVYITSLANDSDLAAKPRLSGNGMERGAYECLATLQRVLYVQPTLSSSFAGDGSSWEHPFGQGQLQNAIDAAAVYNYLNQNAPYREDKKAYVFVKGSFDARDHTDLQGRDGVFVYGSLPGNFNDTAAIDPDSKQFTNDECQRFVNYVRASSTGAASPNVTRIKSIHVEGDDFETGFLLDGFMIANPGAELHASPVILKNEMTALRNCLITDNKVVDVPVVDVTRGLLYNNLIYGDSASAIVKVGANGLALNNTIVTDEAAAEPLDATAAADGAVVNNIALNSKRSSLNCFAPYFTDRTPYPLPDYLKEDKPLSYQLHEHSAYIHAGTDDQALGSVYASYIADSTIAFRYDRDVLGNPRKIGSGVDMGALETWKVEKKGYREITARTNKVGSESTVEAHKRYAFLENYGGNDYPHPGSVVYLMDSSAMSMQYEALSEDFVDLKTGLTPFALRPGYMLLKSGASFYGNGHTVQMNYLAAEKRFKNQRYSMTSFPFNYSAEDITTTKYYPDKDSLAFDLSPFTFSTYQYAGDARSEKDYVFQPTNSSLWHPVDTLNRTATDGYLMDFGTVMADTVLRFTSFAPSGTNSYTEDGSDKTVYLTQYDHRQGGTGSSLDFTTQENMGWNMKGLPWLVSYYRTDTIIWEDNFVRQMYIPHVIYQMDGSMKYGIAGDQAYTSRSWDRGTTVSMGSAFLTQTATQSARETVVFHIPYYDQNKKVASPAVVLSASTPPQVAHAPMRKAVSGYRTVTEVADMLTLLPDSAASKRIQYAYGRDGIKWNANDSLPQMYVLDSKGLSRISLLGAAPIEVDIPVGVKVPANYDGYNFSFRLPSKEAFENYPSVWLIDYEKKSYINLKDEDYEVPLATGEYTKRFAIRIGALPRNAISTQKKYTVYMYRGTLYIRGLQTGDRITVYSPSGQLVQTAVADGYEYSSPMLYQTSYIVRVNDETHKVL